MQEKEAIIGIYDEEGNLIAKKPRKEVDKKKDILKTVKILAFNKKGEIFMIKEGNPAIWSNKWGGSCASLVRADEKPTEAAKRTLMRELGITKEPKFIGERFIDFGDAKRHWNVFVVKDIDKVNPNKEDFSQTKWTDINEAKKLISEGKCMPSFGESLKMIGPLN